MSRISKSVYFFISVLFFIVFDIYFSNLIVDNIDKLSQNKIVDFIFVQNTGAAFNILENSKIFLIAFSIVAFCGILLYVIKNISKISSMSLFWTAILSAGIFCNLYERIVFGFVRDFIKLNFVNFPIFNISDVFINISVFAIVVIIIKNNYFGKNENNN